MRKEIIDSWKRCEIAGLWNGSNSYPLETLGDGELDELKKTNLSLLEIASPIIKELHDFVHGSGFLTMLTTNDGIILEILDDSSTRLFTSEYQLIPGAVWGERHIGTSAIGLTLREERPFQVVGTEHYWKKLHGMTCSAAPICDESGKVLGILNVSGPVDLVHVHTLGMVVSAVKAIERQYQLSKITEDIQQSNETLNTLLNVVEDGVILVDESLTIVQVNQKASKILKSSPDVLNGRAVIHFFSNSRVRESILSQTQLQDELMKVTKLNITCLVQVKPILTTNGSAVIIFREVQHISRSARRIKENKAYITKYELRGSSKEMDKLRKKVQKVAQSDVTSLILGETGSGKEVVAQSIHNSSERKEGPFIVVNCAALPRTLLESELFGYEAGTFTGGLKQGKPGKFEVAEGGTIFLDEIGEMSSDIQATFLRVLQEKSVTRLGASKPVPVDARIIAATNKDLKHAVERGEFRADLYYRLNILQLGIPPLRSRLEDIPELVKWFVTKNTPQNSKEKDFRKDAIKYLQQYQWFGNVRELENIVQRCLVMTEKEIIDDQVIRECMGEDTINSFDNIKPDLKMDSIQEKAFLKAYHQTNGNITKTAQLLGVSRATAYRWANKFYCTNQSEKGDFSY
ncbi:sigma-54-dependent Fis family transcriptional regulator [Lentibacillus salinarum]|uniref:Sigma-54-dependent Fis family transcriptional regulator n=1 Tax=Lentibacillus salinarum TaxID=446820 RepID=A0ABW3ZYS5_9BACI